MVRMTRAMSTQQCPPSSSLLRSSYLSVTLCCEPFLTPPGRLHGALVHVLLRETLPSFGLFFFPWSAPLSCGVFQGTNHVSHSQGPGQFYF